jgi:hypothetical protein
MTHQVASCKLTFTRFDSQIVFVVQATVVCPVCPLLLIPADAWGSFGHVGQISVPELPISIDCFILRGIIASLRASRPSSVLSTELRHCSCVE